MSRSSKRELGGQGRSLPCREQMDWEGGKGTRASTGPPRGTESILHSSRSLAAGQEWASCRGEGFQSHLPRPQELLYGFKLSSHQHETVGLFNPLPTRHWQHYTCASDRDSTPTTGMSSTGKNKQCQDWSWAAQRAATSEKWGCKSWTFNMHLLYFYIYFYMR